MPITVPYAPERPFDVVLADGAHVAGPYTTRGRAHLAATERSAAGVPCYVRRVDTEPARAVSRYEGGRLVWDLWLNGPEKSVQ